MPAISGKFLTADRGRGLCETSHAPPLWQETREGTMKKSVSLACLALLLALLYDNITHTYSELVAYDAIYVVAVNKLGDNDVTSAINHAGYFGITAMELATAKVTYPAGEQFKLEALAQIFPK